MVHLFSFHKITLLILIMYNFFYNGDFTKKHVLLLSQSYNKLDTNFTNILNSSYKVILEKLYKNTNFSIKSTTIYIEYI